MSSGCHARIGCDLHRPDPHPQLFTVPDAEVAIKPVGEHEGAATLVHEGARLAQASVRRDERQVDEHAVVVEDEGHGHGRVAAHDIGAARVGDGGASMQLASARQSGIVRANAFLEIIGVSFVERRASPLCAIRRFPAGIR
ncbi:MAG TPA: hypothetical protein VHZ29_16700 [Rhizomicrobium sp.]|jgi:hypothetical protein|nr:hypothetical protein [Rhizomicrobium sp.]